MIYLHIYYTYTLQATAFVGFSPLSPGELTRLLLLRWRWDRLLLARVRLCEADF